MKEFNSNIFKGIWEKRFPDFIISSEKKLIVKIESKKGHINVDEKIIYFKRNEIKPNLFHDSFYSDKLCPICKERVIKGYFEGFLPLLINRESRKSILISETNLGRRNNVVFCPKCSIFITPLNEFDIIRSDEKKIEESVNLKRVASETYIKNLKKWTIIGGFVSMSMAFLILLISFFRGKLSSDTPVTIYPLIVIFSFLMGAPFGALIGSIIGRLKNKKAGRPPF